MPIESDWLGDLADSTPAVKTGRPRKDGRGRQRKLHCERCQFICYATDGALKRSGFPVCACGEPLVLANLADRAVVEWDTLQRELEGLGPHAYNAAMRELGYRDLVEPIDAAGHIENRARRGGAGYHRCAVHGCDRFVSGTYCNEHEHDRPAVGAVRKGI